MADQTLEPGIRPTSIEIIPVEDVVAITSHYNALIRKLEDELADATAEAALAEERLLVHPAATVIDDDFESFVLWATQTRLIDIHRDDADRVPEVGTRTRRPPAALDAVLTEEPPAAPRFHEHDAPAPPPPAPTIAAPVPPVAAPTPPPPPPAPVFEPPTVATPTTTPAAPPAPRRSSRSGSGTTVVTRPGAPAPAPAPEAEPVANAAPAPNPAAPVAPQAPDAPAPAESFWEPARNRAPRAERPTRAERDARRGLGSLPSTLMLQAGAVFVIVALLVLKLG